MEAKLTRLLQTDAVPMEKLHEQYGALLTLVEKLIGVVPNCDPYLEIWPTAFRTYNILVPNFLNLPFALWGVGAPKEVVGLSMYAASRSAACAYCSAHTASFALRRGAPPDKIANALTPTATTHSAGERAAIAVASSLGRVPCSITEEERAELRRHYSPDQVEWIVLGISMMGFLNKFMDAMGIDLEEPTIGEVQNILTASGWKPGKHGNPGQTVPSKPLPSPDSFGSNLRVIPLIPSALSMDRSWTAGVPKRWPAIGDYLRQHLGHDFPVLSRLVQGRAIRAVGVMLRDNFDPKNSVIGLPTKIQAGAVYATVIKDEALMKPIREMATHLKVLPEQMNEAIRFAEGDVRTLTSTPRTRALLSLARAASPSPARITEEISAECQSAGVPAPAIIELISWISVLQMLHRLTAFWGSP